jgi:hypothetical protein
MNSFTSPEDMLNFAISKGLSAAGYNNGTWQDIEGFISQGLPCVLVLNANFSYPSIAPHAGESIQGGGSINGLHYNVITGFGTDAVTGQRYAVSHDSNFFVSLTGTTTPVQGGDSDVLHFESDLSQMGDDLTFFGPYCLNDFYMVFGGPGANVGPGDYDGCQAILGTLQGVCNITNGIMNVGQPTSVGGFFGGIFQFVGGVVGTVGCGIGGLVQILGNWVSGVGDNIPVLSNILGTIGAGISGVGAVIGTIFDGVDSIINDIGQGVGNAINSIFNGFVGAGKDIGGAFSALGKGNFAGFFEGVGASIASTVGGILNAVGSVINSVGNAISDAASAVAGAVSDVASAIGNAVSSFFSGW